MHFTKDYSGVLVPNWRGVHADAKSMEHPTGSMEKKQDLLLSGLLIQQTQRIHGSISHDIRSLMRVVCCPKVARNDLRLPHTPDNPPFFWRLKGCKKNERTPHHVATCSECGWERRLYECPLEWTQAPAHFMRWEPTELPGTTKKGGGEYAKVLRRINCTCTILLQTIQKKHRAVMYHLWVDAMAKQQEWLDVATFDGKSVIIIKTDFAATAKLQVRLKIVCKRV